MKVCPFCARIAAGEITARRGLAVSLPDAFPLTNGHTLVLPVAHEPDLFATSAETLADVWALVAETTGRLRRDGAEGVNIGVNVGEAAGQTVAHAHVHVIPRLSGDVADPRGGIRWMFPERAVYWEIGQ